MFGCSASYRKQWKALFHAKSQRQRPTSRFKTYQRKRAVSATTARMCWHPVCGSMVADYCADVWCLVSWQWGIVTTRSFTLLNAVWLYNWRHEDIWLMIEQRGCINKPITELHAHNTPYPYHHDHLLHPYRHTISRTSHDTHEWPRRIRSHSKPCRRVMKGPYPPRRPRQPQRENPLFPELTSIHNHRSQPRASTPSPTISFGRKFCSNSQRRAKARCKRGHRSRHTIHWWLIAINPVS